MNKNSGRTWINFKELRARLKFEEVLKLYGVEPKSRDGQHVGPCPLPGHEGPRSPTSFSANLEKGIFQCFGCKTKGNVLDFAGLMEKANIGDGLALRKVAVKLQARFCPEGATTRTGTDRPEKPHEQLKLPAIVNAPLDFELKGLQPEHEYLAGRGFSGATINVFGVGYCTRGYLAGRIAIPLHDAGGKLVGYAGRVIDDKAVAVENPKYRFPIDRERGGAALEFRKDRFLYGGHLFKDPVERLIVVEGFPSVWWLHQHGYREVVATMGPECSEEQAKLILDLVAWDGQVTVIPDGDEQGSEFARKFFDQVGPRLPVRWLKLGKGRKPTSLPLETLRADLGG